MSRSHGSIRCAFEVQLGFPGAAILLAALVFPAFGAFAEPLPGDPAGEDQEYRAHRMSPFGSPPSNGHAEPAMLPLSDIPLNIRADRQTTDALKAKLLAEGNVQVEVSGGLLLADHVEYVFATRILVATGAVRFNRGSQYVQASSFRYDFVREEGELKDAYGIISFDTQAQDLDFRSPPEELTAVSKGVAMKPQSGHPMRPEAQQRPPMACPLLVPADHEQSPENWAITLWGGSRTHARLGESLTFKGEALPGGLLGFGVQRRLLSAGKIEVVLDFNLMKYDSRLLGSGSHRHAAFMAADAFTDVTAGIGLRAWLHPRFSLAVTEGISWKNETWSSDHNLPSRTVRSLRNSFGLEAELALDDRWSMVGRIHHRSGSDHHGQTSTGSSYLAGVRYRFGRPQQSPPQRDYLPPEHCPNPDRGSHHFQPLDDLLNLVAFSPSPSRPTVVTNTSPDVNSQLQQPVQRTTEQLVSDVKAKQGLQLVQLKRHMSSNSLVTELDNNRDPAIPLALRQLEDSGIQLLDGQISRWRFQAKSLEITPEGLTSPRIALTNDPLTPAQLVIEGWGTSIWEHSDGEVEIISAKHRGLLDGRMTIPMPNRILLRQESFRWSLLGDQEDRDGLYIERTMDTRSFLGGELKLKPQFMLDRVLSGTTSVYPPAGASIAFSPIERSITPADLVGLDIHYARPAGPTGQGEFRLQADLATFAPDHLAEATRAEASIQHPISVPVIGDVMGNMSAAYRFSVWNGSLGHQDVYTAFGGFLEQTRQLSNLGPLSNHLFWRLGAQNINATIFDTTDLSGKTWRTAGYIRLTSALQVWQGKMLQDSEAALRYSKKPIHPGMRIIFISIGESIRYGDGNSQSAYTFSALPSLTLGHFSRSYFDYTQLTIGGSISIVDRLSPYAFDRAVDLGILHASLQQQIFGPLLFSLDFSYNIDKDSENHGKIVDSLLQLQWQRRAYELSVFYSPKRKIGGLQIRLNDFDWRGTGRPFMPYAPLSWSMGWPHN